MPEPEQETGGSVPPAPPPSRPPAGGHCGNCGSPLLGEYCYACGQSVSGLVRHFSSIVGDFTDTVLNWDSRLPRTLWPLLVRPGFLTREYFSGRRVRYVSPVRLFVTLAVITFFVAQLMLSFGDGMDFDKDKPTDVSFSQVQTVDEVVRQRDEALAELAQARGGSNAQVPGLGAGLGIAEKAIRNSADARIRVLQRKEAKKEKKAAASPSSPGPAGAAAEADAAVDAERAGVATPDDGSAMPGAGSSDGAGRDDSNADSGEDNALSFNGRPWNAKTNPLVVSWWPDFANRWLNAQVGRGKKNIERMRTDQEFFKDAYLGAMPATLFVLLPLFALMLKIAYIFKRRLYMEHLLVALHSHAFLCLTLLLVFLVMALQRWLAPDPGALRSLFMWIEILLWTWMPLYLLLMQKRAYGQGWTMTLLKYSVLGFCYVILLSFGAAFAAIFALVNA
ncbi:DUF3667 domain-containing protein [Luteimonas lutimaris]|uniref:DUF3667 domain-containing protein n=1 Tax=Luteimonas lutimaris TaxID=698645 RepID=UPI0031D25DDA